MSGVGNFIKDEDAGATVEFVAIMGPMILIVFFIFEVMVEMVWIGTAEKAAQAGARLAVVSNSVASGMPTTNVLTSTAYKFGQPCSTGACTAMTAAVCTGAAGNACSCTGGSTTCDATAFARVVTRMHDVFGLTQSQYVRITYSDSGLGFAGGPVIPMVKLELGFQNNAPHFVPYGGVVTGLIGNIFNAGGGTNGFGSTLPGISVTLTGEDLSS